MLRNSAGYSVTRMKGVLRFAPLMLLPFATLADGQQVPAPIPVAATDPGAMVSITDLGQRLTVPVELGAAGPFPFVIDTGAERTVVSHELAGLLGLAGGPKVNLATMTGHSEVGTVIVPELTITGLDQRHRIEAPALAARNLGAAGLLGIDTLAGHRVSIDLETGKMAVRPALKRGRHHYDEIVVEAKSLFGQLIVTDAWLGDAKIRVLVDTGSQVSIGNSLLRKRAALTQKGMRAVEVTSVTGETIQADYAVVPRLAIGNVQFGALPIAFADVEPFARFGLTDKPALLLGMDALRSFRRVDIDFANREVRFVLPKGFRDERSTTGTLIRGGTGASSVRSY